MNKKFYKSINWFRGIAMIFIVLTHIPVYENTISEKWHTQFTLFKTDGSFFFVFIAGFLFFHLKDRYDYIPFLKNKFKNVISPYLICITPLLLLAVYFNLSGLSWFNANLIPSYVSQNNIIYYISYLVSTGGAIMEPYWFIPMTAIFFLFSPFLIKTINSKYFYLITLITLAFTLTTNEAGLVSPVQSAIHWVGVYLFGAFICKHFIIINKYRYYLFFPCLFLTIITIFLDNELVVFNYINHDHIIRVPFTLMFLTLFSIIEHDISKLNMRMLDIIAKYSFGVYFLHPYIIQVLKMLPIEYNNYGFLSWISMLVITLVFSIISLMVMKKITDYKGFNSKLIFGV
ncbi:acyltransferase family protein [Photobacterium carnosum]|uniref:acyltransferase family protein n=1 Tax=Photobacterium carnosum TaxID=2023717 RepID=UPI001E2DB436|nr:acyltransferase [Photobacterium carnosum]MCD9551796.1 acyltransferase family protein [Photobacterium carnosum]